MTEAWRNRIVGYGEVAASELMPNPKNWRGHPAMQATALGKGLDAVGWVSDVIVNKTTGNLVDGHLRVALALKRGAGTAVPVKFVELSAEEEMAVLVTLDPLAAMATTDEAMLLANVRSLDETDFADMVADVAKHLGIDGAGELPADPGPQVDKTEELRVKWGVETGQLWQLGEHRLICGDCTDAAVVARVMGGEKAGMVFIDPPYATFGSSTGKMELGDYNMLRPFWQRLAETIHENLQDGRGAFICCDWRSYPSLFEVVGGKMKPANLIVWNHKAMKLGAQFRPAYELILYVINYSFKRSWVAENHAWKIKDRSITDVWEIGQGEASPGQNREHSSQKPVALVEHALTHCSNSSDAVIDFFLGSGTTLIACERLRRRCRAVEISPAYVAVALERWAVMTGRTPEVIA